MAAPYTAVHGGDYSHGYGQWITYQAGVTFSIQHWPNYGPSDGIKHVEWSVMAQQPDGTYAAHPAWPSGEVGRYLAHYRLALFDVRGNLVR